MTVTSIEVPIRTEAPKLGFRFEVDFDEAKATVAYRAARTESKSSEVLTIHHNLGRGLRADWVERWRAYLAPNVRQDLVAKVQRLLVEHYA
ncbi:hypothetical protein GCM10029992_12290 [Glycomyces albus]